MGSWQITPYFYLYLLATVLSFLFAIIKFGSLNSKSLKYYRLLMMGTGFWSLGYLLGFFNTDLEWKLIALRIEVFGGLCTTYFWFLFAVSYTQYEQKFSKTQMVLLAIIPVVTLIEVFAIKYHNCYYKSYGIATKRRSDPFC